jgi:hypothetical protein
MALTTSFEAVDHLSEVVDHLSEAVDHLLGKQAAGASTGHRPLSTEQQSGYGPLPKH